MTTAPMISEDARIAHLGMIQGVISRVASDAQNSRTLAITLAAAMIAVAQTGSAATHWLAVLGIAPSLLFWWQNAFALHVERSYRNLYDEIRTGRPIEPFTMDWRTYKHSAGPFRTALEFVVALPFATVIVILAVVAKLSA
ncbi:hypothetical protein [Devosia submarina]|uniref:hypothetical protein n=1 Tax=Devosia submarina TaxID=1173082 RepID=UPI000D354C4D|nr:hypothetical protein [Devosia submarina]